VIAATDYVRLFAEQIRPAIQHMGRRFEVLGTDGFGRSDTREKLRDFLEVDRRWIVLTALRSLVDAGQLDRQKLSEAIKKYEIDFNKPNPMIV
jgi:pyruvate dehydrogenase E1 component